MVSSLKKSLKTIDPHVHLRKINSGFIQEGLKEAEKQGIRIVFDMPNLGTESVLRIPDLIRRLTWIKEQNFSVKWFQWICLTSNEEQIKNYKLSLMKKKVLLKKKR